MPPKITRTFPAPTDADWGHLQPAKKQKTDELPSKPVAGDKKRRQFSKRQPDTATPEDDFEEGFTKLKQSGSEQMLGALSSNNGFAPAVYPESSEQMKKTLQASWNVIEEIKAKEREEGPPFGKTIEKLLTFSQKKGDRTPTS